MHRPAPTRPVFEPNAHKLPGDCSHSSQRGSGYPSARRDSGGETRGARVTARLRPAAVGRRDGESHPAKTHEQRRSPAGRVNPSGSTPGV